LALGGARAVKSPRENLVKNFLRARQGEFFVTREETPQRWFLDCALPTDFSPVGWWHRDEAYQRLKYSA
jgi:hypothetical protein